MAELRIAAAHSCSEAVTSSATGSGSSTIGWEVGQSGTLRKLPADPLAGWAEPDVAANTPAKGLGGFFADLREGGARADCAPPGDGHPLPAMA